MDIQAIIMALGLTLVAGLSTGIGSLLAFFAKATNTRFLSGALGLSGGVMVYVSFMDLLPESIESLSSIFQGKLPEVYALAAFFAGVLLIAAIDYLIPEDENPHEMHNYGELNDRSGHNHHIKRAGVMVALAIGIHNFPEGLATFVAALDGIEGALPIVVAIAIHNIPEGVAVSVPIYYATGDKRKALRYSFLTGLAEPLGAGVGAAFLLPFWNPVIGALLLALVAGIMVYISFDELLPSAEQYGHHHCAIIGVVAGMAIMAGGLLLF